MSSQPATSEFNDLQVSHRSECPECGLRLQHRNCTVNGSSGPCRASQSGFRARIDSSFLSVVHVLLYAV